MILKYLTFFFLFSLLSSSVVADAASAEIKSLIHQLKHERFVERMNASSTLIHISNDAKKLDSLVNQLISGLQESESLEASVRSFEILTNIGIHQNGYFHRIDHLLDNAELESHPLNSCAKIQLEQLRLERHQLLAKRLNRLGASIDDDHLKIDAEFRGDVSSILLATEMKALSRITLKKFPGLQIDHLKALLKYKHLDNITLDRCAINRNPNLSELLATHPRSQHMFILNGAFLGIYGANYTPEHVKLEKKQADEGNKDLPEVGALILGVNAFPAIETGMQQGDVITQMDGKKVNSFESLLRMIGQKNPGETAKFSYFRIDDKKTFKVTVKLGERP